MRKRICDLNPISDHCISGETARWYGFGQRLPIDELHGDVRLAVDVASLVNGADVRVAQAGRCAGFFKNSCAIARIDAGKAFDDFDGDGALQFLVVRAVNDAHSSGAQPGQDSEVSERFADHSSGKVKGKSRSGAGRRSEDARFLICKPPPPRRLWLRREAAIAADLALNAFRPI
jgi:hypothetical protein